METIFSVLLCKICVILGFCKSIYFGLVLHEQRSTEPKDVGLNVIP